MPTLKERSAKIYAGRWRVFVTKNDVTFSVATVRVSKQNVFVKFGDESKASKWRLKLHTIRTGWCAGNPRFLTRALYDPRGNKQFLYVPKMVDDKTIEWTCEYNGIYDEETEEYVGGADEEQRAEVYIWRRNQA